MATSLNALTLRIGTDTTGMAAGVKAVRADINRVNRALRSSMDETAKLKEKTDSLNRVYKTGAIGKQQYSKALDQITAASKRTAKAIAEIESPVNRISAKLAALGIAYAGIRLAKGGFTLSGEMEKASIAFEVMSGSAEEAKQIIDDLKKLDRDAPTFGFPELQRSTKALIGYGVQGMEATEITARLSAVSIGNAESLQRLSLAMAQVSAKTRLTGEEVRQFVNAGFNPLQQIAKDTGKSIGEVEESMRKGQITFEMVAKSLENATSGSGRFAGMNERLAASASGAFSRLSNTVEVAAADIASYFTPALAEVARAIANIIDAVMKWGRGLNDSQRKMWAVVAGIGGFLLVVPRAIAAIRGIIAVVTMWRNSQIALLAFTGPKGWAQIAAGAAIAAGAIYAVDAAFEKHNKTLADTADQAKQVNAARVAGTPGLAGLVALDKEYNSGSQTARDVIASLQKQKDELTYTKEQLEDQAIAKERIKTVEAYSLSVLREQVKAIKDAKKADEHRLSLAKERQAQLAQEAKQRAGEASRIMESVQSPFQKLVSELTDLNRLRMDGLLSQQAFDKAKGGAVSDFAGKAMPVKMELPPSITRGSREEYRLIAESQNKTAQLMQRRHIEQLAEAKANRIAAERAAAATERTATETVAVEAAIRELSIGDAV